VVRFAITNWVDYTVAAPEENSLQLVPEETRMLNSPPAVPRIAPTRFRAVLLAGALFTFFFMAYVFSASADLYSTGDTEIRIQIAENLSSRIDMSLHGWKLQYPKHLKKEFYDPRISLGRGGQTYSTYLPGQPLFIIPFDFIGSRLSPHERWTFGPAVIWFDRLVGPLMGALEALIFFLFAVRLGYGRRVSLLLTLLFGFATMAWPDEQSVNEHSEVAFFLLLGWYFVFRFREQRAPPWYLFLAGAGIGGAFITRYQDAALGLVGLGVYLLLPSLRTPSVRNRVVDCIRVGCGLFPFVVLILWYNWARFGSITQTGHHETTFGYAIWKGAAGLLISPGKGLLWYCPTIFLLVFAGPWFYRRFSAMTIGMAAMVASFFLLYGYVTFWHGDPAWGPRYVYPVVPFLTLPLGELLKRMRRISPMTLISSLVIAGSLLIQVSAVTVSPWRSWYRVIAYEESQGYQWEWIASRYRYFWNVQESPLNFQLHGLYQMVYDSVLHSNKYELVPPDEDPILDRMTVDYALNQWNFWWKSDELDWWMGRQKIVAEVLVIVALALASGTYLAAEGGGLFDEPDRSESDTPVMEAA